MENALIVALVFSVGGLFIHVAAHYSSLCIPRITTFALSFLAAISSAFLLASCQSVVYRTGGVVHNPRPDSLANPCSTNEIQIVLITDPGESGLNKDDKVAATNDELDSLCNGDIVEVNVKKGKFTKVDGKKMPSAELVSHRRNQD